MKLIDKSAVVAEIEGLKRNTFTNFDEGVNAAAQILLDFLDALEVEEVNIADMADDYYDALMKEAADWMDEGTMGHCRLAYYTGCKDVLNKLRKRE